MVSHSKMLLILLSGALGITFIISAGLKLFPIEIFEFSIAETGFFSWESSSVVARLLIGIELCMGIFLIFRVVPRLVIPLAIAMLVFFSVYLVWMLMRSGNSGNCNCFGIHWVVSPKDSLLKNIGMVGLLGLVYWYSPKVKWNKKSIWIAVTLMILSVVFPFVANPMAVTGKTELKAGGTIDFSPVESQVREIYPALDLSQGDHLILFASPKCQHCISAAYKIKVIQDRTEELSVFFFLNGKTENIEKFHVLTATAQVPYIIIPADLMIEYTRGSLPVIVMVSDGHVMANPNYYDINDDLIRDWLSK
jgi:hypothetical protein